MKKYKLPKLRDYNGDINKRWCVYYSVYIGGKFVRKVEWISLKYDRKNRYLEAEKLIKQYTEKLESGDKALFSSNYTQNGEERNKETFPISLMIDRAFNYKKSYLSERSISSYGTQVKKLKKWLDKKHLLNSSINTFNGIQANLFFEETFLKKGINLSGQTLNDYVSIYRSLFARIIKISHLEHNPFNFELFKETDPEINIWDEKHTLKLAKYLKENEPQMFVILLFVYHCFLRPNEIRQIQFKDIDLKRGIITVSNKKGKGVLVKHPTLSNQLVEILTEIKEKGYPETYYLFSKWLLPGTYQISRNVISARFLKIRRKLNIPEQFKLYNFKHTGNSEFAESGLDIRAQQWQNGHTSPLITEKYIKRLNFSANENIKKLQKRL